MCLLRKTHEKEKRKWFYFGRLWTCFQHCRILSGAKMCGRSRATFQTTWFRPNNLLLSEWHWNIIRSACVFFFFFLLHPVVSDEWKRRKKKKKQRIDTKTSDGWICIWCKQVDTRAHSISLRYVMLFALHRTVLVCLVRVFFRSFFFFFCFDSIWFNWTLASWYQDVSFWDR